MADIEDAVVALDFDLAAAARLMQDERRALEESLESAGIERPARGRPREVNW